MDPLACWKEICFALSKGDLDTAIDRMDALEGWLRKEGYPPYDPMPSCSRLRNCRLVLAEINRYLNQR